MSHRQRSISLAAAVAPPVLALAALLYFLGLRQPDADGSLRFSSGMGQVEYSGLPHRACTWMAAKLEADGSLRSADCPLPGGART